MRLHRLRISAFLAFPGVEEVDLDALGEAGLFLLQGRTGAGKTSLLDAICFAFYGEVPGARGKDARLRSDHAAAHVRTEVELEATVRGQRIRVIRTPPQLRPKLRGSGVTEESPTVRVMAVDDQSERVLATRLEEARGELTRLLGLSCQQFCQVVLLPQGGFARFLQSNSADREVLLRELFQVERFSDVEKWLLERRNGAQAARDRATRAVRDVLERSAQVAGVDPPEDWEADLSAAERWLEEQSVLTEASVATAKSGCEQAGGRSREATRELDAARALAEHQERLRVAGTALKEWETGRHEHDARCAELAVARRAAPAQTLVAKLAERDEVVRSCRGRAHRACTDAERAGLKREVDARAYRRQAAELRHRAGSAKALLERERRVEEAANELQRLRLDADQRDAEARRLSDDLARAEQCRPHLAERLSSACQAEAALGGRREAAELAARRVDSGIKRDRLRSALLGARERLISAGEDVVGARHHHATLHEQRIDGIAAELAAGLQPASRCPVCGSLEHPSPASPPEGGLVTAEQVALARREVARLEEIRDEMAAARTRVEAELSAAEAIAGTVPLAELQQAAARAAEALSATGTAAATVADRKQELERLDEQVESLRSRRADADTERERVRTQASASSDALKRDRREVDLARDGHPSIADRVRHLLAAARTAEGAGDALDALAQATAEADEARATATRAAHEAGFDDLRALEAAVRATAVLEDLERDIEAWNREFAARSAEAARPELVASGEAPAPDLMALERAANAAQEFAKDAQEALGQARHSHEQLELLHGRLAEAIREAGPVNQHYALVRELADLARGTGTSNRLKMPLSSYVLAARLEEVAAAATIRLQRMSNGRYSLEHDDEGARGNRRGGLDLRVIDAWTGRDRAPSSLSGGETFLTSLALALGLADTVTAEAGGAELETLFIDEGFGSLDDEGTLHDVLEVLDGLRDGGRTIGIVSHVAELRQRIPTQLRIEKGRGGSRIVAMTVAPA